MKKVLAIAALMGVAGVVHGAEVPATLISVASYSPNGSTAWNGTLDTSTWVFDTATGVATMSGGTYSRLSKVGPTPLMRHTMTGVVLGNGAATGTTWACLEGNFGATVGASICGNYNFGSNATNESTYTPTATGSSVAIGGDDGAIGPSQSLANSYSTMLATPPSPTPLVGSTANTTGYDFIFTYTDPVTQTLEYVGLYNSVTAPVPSADTSPDPFFFPGQTGIALNTLTPSLPTAPIAGINAPAPISVSAGSQYAINGGDFTSAAGVVNPGDTVRVQQTSSSDFFTTTVTILTIGTTLGTFTVQTVPASIGGGGGGGSLDGLSLLALGGLGVMRRKSTSQSRQRI